jgi:hypothetical protein
VKASSRTPGLRYLRVKASASRVSEAALAEPLNHVASSVGCLPAPNAPTRTIAEAAKGGKYDFSVVAIRPFVHSSISNKAKLHAGPSLRSKNKCSVRVQCNATGCASLLSPGMLRLMNSRQLSASLRPNPSIEGTANGSACLRASPSPVRPLPAPHVRR